MKVIFKYGSMFALITLAAFRTSADFQLSVTADYPVKLDLKIPVQENSDFKIYTTFGEGQFFNATGHVSQITGTNGFYTLTCWYEYNVSNGVGHASGSATETASGSIHSEFRQHIVSSLWDFNPEFDLDEVPPPVPPGMSSSNAVMTPHAP